MTFGILEVMLGLLTTVVGNSAETSDFIVDALQIWWDDRKAVHSHIKYLTINLDNGPSSASCRTQFIKRITMFAEANGLDIHLVYYPFFSSYRNIWAKPICIDFCNRFWWMGELCEINSSFNPFSTRRWICFCP